MLLPLDCGAESETWFKTEVFTTSGYEAELPVASANVLLLVRNQRAVLSPLLVDGTDPDMDSVCDTELPFSTSELLVR